MKDYSRMVNPENKRKNNHNVVYGNIKGLVDYHKLENYYLNGKTIKDILIEQEKSNELSEKRELAMLDVIKELHKEIKELKEKVKEYGII